METLRVGAAFPDPPFNGMPDGGGLDIDLMTEIANVPRHGRRIHPATTGADFNGIFDGLDSGALRLRHVRHHRDTRTREEGGVRRAIPHLGPGPGRRRQPATARALDRRPRRPDHRCAAGQYQPADRRRACRPGKGRQRPGVRLRQHPHRADRSDHRRLRRRHEAGPGAHRARQAHRGRRRGAASGISTENIAIAVALTDQKLLSRITVAQTGLEEDGTLQRIRRKWLGNPYADQSLAVH